MEAEFTMNTILLLSFLILSFGMIIPSAPASIGTLEYACIIGLSLFNIVKSHALLFGILYHLVQFSTLFFNALIVILIVEKRLNFRVEKRKLHNSFKS